MKVNTELLKTRCSDEYVLNMLINYLNYIFSEIDSYDELCSDEKKIISRELFNEITIP